MITRIRCSTLIVLGAALLAFSSAAWSLGLGDAKVESFLNQPLAVNIELITGSNDALDQISAGLASAEDYELIGASRDDISVPLKFSVEGSQERAFIRVHSDLPVNSPVVRLIVEINWASGRMLREYTLFLDPASFDRPPPAPQPKSQPTRSAPLASTAEAPDTDSSQTQPKSPDSPVESQDSNFAGANEYGPVQSGETLWRIAKDWSAGSGLNLNKVMIAIQRENPDAFSRNNINLLQRGAILRMPDIDSVNSISNTTANNEVKEQESVFQSRQSMASSAAPLLLDENTAPQTTSLPSQQAAEEVQSATTEAQESVEEERDLADTSEPLSLETEPQLELVPPSLESVPESTSGFEELEEGSDASGSVQSLREELARSEEELINQQQQNAYLEQRMKELESQLAESQANKVQDENLASMEERLREERLASAAKAAQPKDEPWFSGLILWLVGLLVLVAVVAGWFMSQRSGSSDATADTSDALRGITGEAEDVLRVLDSEPSEPEQSGSSEIAVAEDSESDATVVAPKPAPAKTKIAETQDDAELLDEESADPEIQLDLARAYISMGDKEAARVILEEVIAHGTDKQKAEASKMKDFL